MKAASLKRVVGIDFDNTIACYDEILHTLASKAGWIESHFPKSKKQIRDHVRSLPDGEIKWQKLQAAIYGPEMHQAKLMEGAMNFFEECRNQNTDVYIISHKTEYAGCDETKTNLQKAALDWMEVKGLFDSQRTGISRKHVFFESTREMKIDRVVKQKCTHFIDDLEETFSETLFPKSVKAILFDPNATSCHTKSSRFQVITSWKDISICADSDFQKKISDLAQSKVLSLDFVKNGRNSRILQARLKNGKRIAVKCYFRSSEDSRDRLNVEYQSLNFLRDHGIKNIPRPLVIDQKKYLAVYEWIEGKGLLHEETQLRDIEQAVLFLKNLYELRTLPEARNLPKASEASFSLEQLLGHLEVRFRRLRSVKENDKRIFKDMHQFLKENLEPKFYQLKSKSSKEYQKLGLALKSEIPLKHRTLSPSDFGFHNAIRTSNGNITFLDFEYFGWDDPAKTICDFLLHPAMKLTEPLKKYFAAETLKIFVSEQILHDRAEFLFPLFALKWCLILLNEFVSHDFERREFASPVGENREKLLRDQLDKSRKMFQNTKFNHGYLG